MRVTSIILTQGGYIKWISLKRQSNYFPYSCASDEEVALLRSQRFRGNEKYEGLFFNQGCGSRSCVLQLADSF